MNCQPKTSPIPDVDVVELKEFETIISFEDDILGTPTIIRYDGESNLFVYDAGKSKVLELDSTGNVVGEYGRPGRGPGEFQRVNNIFLTENNLYVVDYAQYLIHKYDLNGDLNSSMDYGAIGGLSNIPPAPFSPSMLHAEDLNNQPFVTLDGNVMISPVRKDTNVQTVYQLMDWEGNHLADIGAMPEGSSFVLNYEKLRTDVENRVVPAFYRPNAFPVHDHANPEEYFLVYSAIPKIAKYNAAGQKLWENEIAGIPEIDSIKTGFFETMKRIQQADLRNRITLEHYIGGTSNSKGELYLAANSDPLWIHCFNTKGGLIRRHKLISEVKILPIFDIDPTDRRMFVVTEEAEIRAYPF